MLVVLALGTNIGNRAENIKRARNFIEKFVGKILKSSKILETEPFGVKRQPYFLNQVIMVETHHPPLELLNLIKQAEKTLGRFQTYRWGPRVIDIDIVEIENLKISTEKLTVPHKGLMDREYLKKLTESLKFQEL